MDGIGSTPSRPKIWALAARPRTLTAAVAPVLVGTAAAIADGAFAAVPAVAALLGAIFIQIGTNFANDYFDAKKGADRERVGPLRVTQAGLVTERQMRAGIVVAFGFAFLCGIYLVVIAGWPIVIIGLISILCGLAYTGGPYPLGYHGLGELFVFVFFGLIAVAATYYVQALRWDPLVVLLAIPIGLLSVAVLVVNNLRDLESDRRAGKGTLVARYGRRFGQIEYLLVLTGAYALPVALTINGQLGLGGLLPLLSLPLTVPLLRTAFADAAVGDWYHALAGTARLLLLYSILLSIGVIAWN